MNRSPQNMPVHWLESLKPVREVPTAQPAVMPDRESRFSNRFQVQVIRDLAELRAHVAAWEALANRALERNVFYEPFMVLPALEYLVSDERPEFVLIHGERVEHSGRTKPVLCGVFPLSRVRRFREGGIADLEMWGYIHCFLRTPLVHQDCAVGVMKAFFEWLETGSGSRIIAFRRVSADGPFYHCLVGGLHERNVPVWVSVNYVRAVMCRGPGADAYLHKAVSKRRMKEYRRQERRLGEQGALRYEALAAGAGIDPWLEEFLAVEGCGWKGRKGTALGSNAPYRDFFNSMIRGAHARGRLQILAMRLDGRTIAQKLNLTSGDTGFAFKIGFDEQFRRYSPGVLLELENIRYIHEKTTLAWMDSCAEPDHPMIDHLWTERRSIQTLLVGAGARKGDLLIALGPLLRRLKRWKSQAARTFK